MAPTDAEIRDAVKDSAADAVEFLRKLMLFESVQSKEAEVQRCARDAFAQLGLAAELAPIPDALRADAEYSHGTHEGPYASRENLIVRRAGAGGGASLMLNSHTDVVPAGDWRDGLRPVVKDGIVTGRGAVDAKGSVATIYLVMKALGALGVRTRGDLLASVVIEEEVGGNGSLALVRQGVRADAVVVIEPTECRFCIANRGAVWFQLEVDGKPTHMGNIAQGVSAIDKATQAIEIWRGYERELVEGAKTQPLFARFERPVQLCVGMIEGGEWPSMVPAHCRVEGGVGFLPNTSLAEVKAELARRLDVQGDEWLRSHYRVAFNKLHNDAFETPADEPFVKSMRASLEASGLDGTPAGWIASCDARLWRKLAGLPAVVFGPGRLADAHSDHESIRVDDMRTAAAALVRTAIDWCGA